MGLKIFPDIPFVSYLTNKNSFKSKFLNLGKEFKNSGYIRKIHSISKINNKNKDTFHIAESTFFRGDNKYCIRCFDKDFLLIVDYYTNKDMTFYNKLILIQCDFSARNNYNIIAVKEAPYNQIPIRQLEDDIISEIANSKDIKIV